MRIIAVICIVWIALPARAQVADGALTAGLNILIPTYTDFVSNAGTGFRLNYSRFKTDKFGWGFDASYNTLDDYVPRQTYEYPGGAITTDVFNYMYHLTFLVNGQYYYKATSRLVPYASLGAGVALTEYRLFYNVYNESDDVVGFVARPETGLLFRFKEYGSLGLKAAVSFEYATNRSKTYELDNFSGIAFQVGIVLFND
jgi:opacity protein-like surface antigen